MATIRKRGNSYFVEIRRFGHKPVRKTFKTKAEAKRFAVLVEASMDSGEWSEQSSLKQIRVSDVLSRYIDVAHSQKPFSKSKLATVRLTQRNIGTLTLHELTANHVIQYARHRKKTVSQITLSHEMAYFAQAIDMAIALWGVKLQANPVRIAMKPMGQLNMTGASNHRDRRVSNDELLLLYSGCRNNWLQDFIEIAVDNGMRQSEIHRMTWGDISFERREIFIKGRKNPKRPVDAVIPMFPATEQVLLRRKPVMFQPGDRVFFETKLPASVSDKFARLCRKLGLADLHFHDLRHEAISRMFEAGLSIPQVALVSGHRSWEQLKRYTQLSPEGVLLAYSPSPLPSSE